MRRALLAAAALAATLAASAADPVAFVADLKGNATIEGNGKVSFLAELAAGTRLFLGTDACDRAYVLLLFGSNRVAVAGLFRLC